MKVLAFDPGSKNMGYSILSINKAKQKYKVIESGMVINTVQDLKGKWILDIQKYVKEIKKLVKKHKPTHFIAERYILRRVVTGGTTTEGISMMLGITGFILQKLECKLITAAIWKNAFARAFDKEHLKAVYKENKHDITPHQIDASLIGLYLMYDKHHFKELNVKQHLKKLKCKNKNPIPKKQKRQKKK